MKKTLRSLLFGLATAILVFSQNVSPQIRRTKKEAASRLAQLGEANIIAVHAYQVLLAKKVRKR